MRLRFVSGRNGLHSFSCIRRALLIFLFILCGMISGANSQTISPPPAGQWTMPSFAPLAKKVLPAVVSISVTEKRESPGIGGSLDQQGENGNNTAKELDELLRRFFGEQGLPLVPRGQMVALGTGFIIDGSGYIVTNAHVIENAQTVTAIFQDNTRRPARIVGQDRLTDLALLKTDAPKALPYVIWGNSDAAQVGDWVLAVGNPFGLGGSVSSGVIAARGRDIHVGPYDDFLQIDAAINLGNSGGPTFNLAGEVIGVVTAIYTPTGGSVGIGFAIPSAIAKPIIDQLRVRGKVERGWLGVSMQEVTEEIAKAFGLPKVAGSLITDMTPNSPSAKAGIKQGDIILAFDGHDISTIHDLPRLVAQTPIGQTTDLKVWRSKRTITLHAVIAAMPEAQQVTAVRAPTLPPLAVMGLRLGPLTQDIRRKLQLPPNATGAVVSGVAQDSAFADAGIRVGDVIEQIDQKQVNSPEDAIARLTDAQKTGAPMTLLLINHAGTRSYVTVDLSNEPRAG